MNTLQLNWIKFFHNASLQLEVMQNIYNYISELSPGICVTIEEIARDISTSIDMALKIIKSLEESNLLTINSICPECKENIRITDELIFNCLFCGTEINLLTLPIAMINTDASIVNIFKDKIDDNSYETNARILEKEGKERGCLYYLITDIKNSQPQQDDKPNQYSLTLNQLWSDFWPQVFHIAKKASLPIFAKGDAVSWIFIDKGDMLNAIEELALYLCYNPLTKLSIYGSEILIPDYIEISFMRSLDKKWDFNTPSLTKLYRKTEHKHDVWENVDDYVIKYWLFDEMADFANKSSIAFLKKGVLTEYKFDDKHKNHYEGKCFAGYCNAEIMNITGFPHA